MAQVINKNIVVWALDPTQNPKEIKNLLKELKIWTKHLDCYIQPVSIFSETVLNFPTKLVFQSKEKFEQIATKSVNQFLRKAPIKNILPPKLIFSSSSSNRKMALEIAKYAEKIDAQLIFTNTHTKKAASQFRLVRLAGFAETLVATSRIPVLLLNSAALSSTQAPTILFPTDFSHESKIALSRLKSLVNLFRSKVILYNQVETNIYTSGDNTIWPAQGVSIESLIKDIEKTQKDKAKKWAGLLSSENTKCSVLVQRQQKSLVDEILGIAKKNKVNLIAIANQSGPITQAILGGVVKDITLRAKCPVLVFHRPKVIRKRTANFTNKTTSKQKGVEAPIVVH